MTPEPARKRGGQIGRPKGAYRRGGGYHAMWCEVIILALKDWVRTEKYIHRTGATGKTYQYLRADNGPKLSPLWFDGPWCREIVIMIGDDGLKAVRHFFESKSHLAKEKREKILGKVDYLGKYLR